MRTRLFTAVAAAVLSIGAQPVMAQSGHDLFQQALVRERANGELRDAIALYERIVAEFASDRELAAKALVQMGQCYEKLGNSEAQRAYQRVVDEYADQAEMATEARARLAALRWTLGDAGASTIVVRQVWAGPISSGIDFSGGPTPDGSQLAYVEWSTCNVAVREVVTGDSRRLTQADCRTGYPSSPVVSPDGELVAYSWAMGDSLVELRVVGTDGSGPRVLVSDPEAEVWDGAWSTDGRHLAATLYDRAKRTTDIAWIAVADGSLQRLNSFQAHFDRVSPSPDSRFVVAEFRVEQDSLRPDLTLLATDGSGATPLVQHPANDRLLGWLPGTRYVLFLSDRSGSWDLWAVRVEDGEVQGEPRPVKRAIGDVGPMGFTGDGSLFYSHYTLRYTTSIVPFDEGTGRIRLEGSEPLLGASSNNRPAWSPSGEELAFVRRVPAPPGRGWGGNRDLQEVLWVRNMATGQEGALARHLVPATVGTPEWFPDGQSILLIGMLEEDNVTGNWGEVPTALYRVDLASGEATGLVDFPPDTDWWFGIGAVPTSDGEGVVYVRDGRLVVRDIPSGREVELYRHPDLASRILALSPDGENVLFGIADSSSEERRPKVVLNQGGRLMVVPSRGGDVRELVRLEVPGRVDDVAWTSDGRYVLYLQRDEGSTAVMRVVAGGGEPERVWETEQSIRGLSLSPDGQRAAYFTQENEAEIWVMENLREVLGRQP